MLDWMVYVMPEVIIKIPKINIPVKRVEPILIDVDKLLPHEEIVAGRLKNLKEKIKKEGVIDMPIIIAPIPGTDKYLIVDGHHRWAAVKELGYRKIPAIIIDYFDDSVKLGTWYPAIIGDIEEILESIKKEGIVIEKCRDKDLDSMLNSRKYAFIIVGRNGLCSGIIGGINEQKVVSKILSKLNMESKIKLAYYGLKEDALRDLEKGEIDYVFLRKEPSKKEVMQLVKQRKVYSPKTTRHILPYVPDTTNTSLELLK